MMLNNVVLKTLRDKRRAMIGWLLVMTGMSLIYALYWPYIRDNPFMAQMMVSYLQSFPSGLIEAFIGSNLTQFTTRPEAFLDSELFFIFVPLAFILFTVSFGSDAIAGEEDRGTLDLLLSNPMPRSRIVLEKFAALVASTFLLGALLEIELAVASVATNTSISLIRLAEVTLSVILLSLVFGSMALALGCIGLSPGMSTGVAVSLGVASYFVNSLAATFVNLQPYRKYSPFFYYIQADPLMNGLNVGDATVLLALIVVTLSIALLAFQRRDISV
jgi:ABC-2 type transport system permease protein